jgi:hypothetical protein
MLTKKEFAWVIIATLILGFIIGFSEKPEYSLWVFLVAFIIIIVNILAKKIASGFYSIKIEHKPWEFQRYGLYEQSHFKKPFPIGLILPFILSLLSLGIIKLMIILQFDAENLPYKRILKMRGRERRTEINESDLAITSAWGFYALIFTAIIGALLNFPELSKYAVIYGIWNLLPISQTDGSKVFFGSFANWTFLAIIYIISLVLVIL